MNNKLSKKKNIYIQKVGVVQPGTMSHVIMSDARKVQPSFSHEITFLLPGISDSEYFKGKSRV